jgi:hypothetical protein
MKIGFVDLDTSHPAAWIPILHEMGHEVVGVWDGGDVHPPGYAARFAEQHRIPKVYESLDAMAREVDCVLLTGCDWDRHAERALPFVMAGRAVFVDKPIAGNTRDLRQFHAWAEAGIRIAGGSALRYCAEVAAWMARPEGERGRPHTVFCGCGVDEFNYGIHAYALLAAVMGTGARSVQHLHAGAQRLVRVGWADGRSGLLCIGKTAGYLPFHAAVVTERSVAHLMAESSGLYPSLLSAVLPYLARETDRPPVSIESLLEPELWAIAARRSWQHGNQEVLLADLTASDTGYDGAAFAREYRAQKYPGR